MSLPNDDYDRPVSLSSTDDTDEYTIDDSFILDFPAGTDLIQVYKTINSMKPYVPNLGTAKLNKLNEFNLAINQYINDRYTLQQRLQLLNIYILAKEDGLTNRAAYVRQGLTWGNSIITYANSFIASVNSQDDPADVIALMWDIDANVDANPNITAGAAIQIPD